MNKPQYIIIHHSATSRDTTTFKAVDNYHKKYGGIAYHYLITPKKAYKGRGEAVVGAHTLYHNSKSIGICLTGNFQTEKPHPFQLKELERLVRILEKRYKIPRSRIIGHREASRNKTACPGNNLMPFIRELRKPPKPKGIGKALASELGSRLLGRKWIASASFYSRNMEQFIQAITNSAEYKKKRGTDPCAVVKRELKVRITERDTEKKAKESYAKRLVQVEKDNIALNTKVEYYGGRIDNLLKKMGQDEKDTKRLTENSTLALVEKEKQIVDLKDSVEKLTADASVGKSVIEIGVLVKKLWDTILGRIKNV